MSEMQPQYLPVGIIGENETAKQIEKAFTKKGVSVFNTHSVDLVDIQPSVVFICTEPQYSENGSVDASSIEFDAHLLLNRTNALIVIKPVLPIEIVDRICSPSPNIVYNPDLDQEIINGQIPISIIGGRGNVPQALIEIYTIFSKYNIQKYLTGTAVEASITHSAIHSIILMKNAFYNQLYDYMESFGGDFYTVMKNLQEDPRVGLNPIDISNDDYQRGIHSDNIINSIKILDKPDHGFTFLQEIDRINEYYKKRKV